MHPAAVEGVLPLKPVERVVVLLRYFEAARRGRRLEVVEGRACLPRVRARVRVRVRVRVRIRVRVMVRVRVRITVRVRVRITVRVRVRVRVMGVRVRVIGRGRRRIEDAAQADAPIFRTLEVHLVRVGVRARVCAPSCDAYRRSALRSA